MVKPRLQNRPLTSASGGLTWSSPQGSPHLLLCYAWQTLWHEAGTYLAHLRPRKTAWFDGWRMCKPLQPYCPRWA